MRLDLRHTYEEGINLLTNWRNRYSKELYPEKVVINILYRKYTMQFMWDYINNSFQTLSNHTNAELWEDFNTGFSNLKAYYQDTAITKTQPVLMELISNKSDRKVGNISYDDYLKKINNAKNGNKKDLEEIEYAYLFYLLTDESILCWSAFGGTGLNKIDAISRISGVIIETSDIKKYSQIENILGQLCAGPYLEKVYNPFPPL